MRSPGLRLLIVCALVAPFAGCSSNNKGKIEGTTWIVTGGTIPAAGQNVGLEYEFTTDGRLLVGAAGLPKTQIAKYTLGMGSRLNLEIHDSKTGKTSKEFTSLKIDGDTMTMTDSDKTYLSFKRKGTGASPGPDGDAGKK
jgi:hypothetical protein